MTCLVHQTVDQSSTTFYCASSSASEEEPDVHSCPSGRPAGRRRSPERDRGEAGEHDGGAGGGAAQVHERLAPRLALLPPLLAPHELEVPPLGLLRLPLPAPPGRLHRRGEEPQRALAADRGAVSVLDGEGDLGDVPGPLGAGHDGLELAPAQRDREAHQRLARVPVPVHGHRAPAGDVHGAAPGRVRDHPAQLQLRGRRPRRGLCRRRPLALDGLDAERRAEEPRRRRGRLHHARQQRRAPAVDVHRGDQLPGEPELAIASAGADRGREREGVGEEAARRDRGQEAAGARQRERRPLGEAERAPRLRVRG
jgi:hypothetical protein